MRADRKFKILGMGAVVKAFLSTASTELPRLRFEVYSRETPNEPSPWANASLYPLSCFASDSMDVVFLCCSTNEEALLRKQGMASGRWAVADANTKIIAELIGDGFLDQGTVFVLTNPSDLIAEGISAITGNARVFGLGLSADFGRYRQILKEFGIARADYLGIEVSGNHWDAPLPVGIRPGLVRRLARSMRIPPGEFSSVEEQVLRRLQEMLFEKIVSEFTGFKPPVTSGVSAMLDCVAAFQAQGSTRVTGKASGYDCFIGGKFDALTGEFRAMKPGAGFSTDEFDRTLSRHRSAAGQILRMIS